jgi:O-antigen/teichoic acid export membrane protein
VEWILAANLLASAVKLAMALRGNLPTRWRLHGPTAKAMRRYGLYIMIAGLAGALNEVLGRNLLPRLWPAEGAPWRGEMLTGLELNGIYGTMYKLAMFITLATQAFRFAVEPFYFRTAQDKDSPRHFARIFHLYTTVTLGMMLVIACFRWELVTFGWGDRTLFPVWCWVGLEVVPLVLLANVLLAAYLNLSIWFKLTKQVRYALLFTGGGAVITVGWNLLFIPEGGYMASAWAAVLCYGAMCVACWWLGHRHYPIPYQWERLGLYTAVTLLLMWWCSALSVAPPVPFAITLLKGVLVGSVLWAVYALERYRPLRW